MNIHTMHFMPMPDHHDGCYLVGKATQYVVGVGNYNYRLYFDGGYYILYKGERTLVTGLMNARAKMISKIRNLF